MKFSEAWLREWANPSADTKTLGDKLTSLGLEVESITPEGPDHVIELGITPNRGDCLSILGVAREVSVGFGVPMQLPLIDKAPVSPSQSLSVNVDVPRACPRYLGRIIADVNCAAPTPEWLKSRLEKSGMQSTHIVVDITNYVMLELGQPMHAFDFDTITGNIHVRMSNGEKTTLLNDSEVALPDDTLVICDDKGVIALAGVMGTLNSAVTAETKSIFLESAFFAPSAIAGRMRALGIHSDAAQRFERGVDPELASYAMDRATQLIIELAGGQAGEVTESAHPSDLPTQTALELSHDKLCSMLGMTFDPKEISTYFEALNMSVTYHDGIYEVTAPSYRFDINIPEDLIEEVIRIVGYNNIPEAPLPAVPGHTPSESSVSVPRVKVALVDRGYHEVVTYSFVDKKWQEVLFPEEETQDLLNPISPDMGSMRLSIWPGLLKTLAYNQNRQMNDVRIFEIGQCFREIGAKLAQSDMIAGLISGQAHPLHWGMDKRPVDFFDIKGDIEALLGQTLDDTYYFVPDTHSALAPGQTAAIMRGDLCVGWVGALHPMVANKLDIKLPVFLFELKLDNLLTRKLPVYEPLSKFPAIRRDLAVLVDANIQADALLLVAQEKAGPLLKNIHIFDVYQGERIEKGKKSIALGLILQDSSRTLIDKEVNDLMQAVVQGLEQAFQATVRE